MFCHRIDFFWGVLVTLISFNPDNMPSIFFFIVSPIPYIKLLTIQHQFILDFDFRCFPCLLSFAINCTGNWNSQVEEDHVGDEEPEKCQDCSVWVLIVQIYPGRDVFAPTETIRLQECLLHRFIIFSVPPLRLKAQSHRPNKTEKEHKQKSGDSSEGYLEE